MSDAVTTTAVCRNPLCAKAAAGEALEWYPGPGEYCPECGEALHLADPAPFAFSSPQAYREFESRMLGALIPPGRTPVWRTRPFLASLVVLSAAALGAVFLGAQGLPRRHVAANALAVCRTSITERLAGDVVRAYVATSGTSASRFALVDQGACAVRFSTTAARAGQDSAVVGHDGIVVVVNPQNPVSELTLAQVRAILSGAVTDWAQLGGTQGTIVPLAPPDGSDEARLLTTKLLDGEKLAGVVQRSRSSAQIARAVAAPSGRARLGIVAFSVAAPAKVVAFRSIAPPSALSIADGRYPFSLDVLVRRERASRDPLGVQLEAYARSDAVQTLVVRNGLVAKAGF